MNSGSAHESDYERGHDRMCQGSAPGQRPCNMDGTVHCIKCDGWFCDAHAEDETWHACMREQT